MGHKLHGSDESERSRACGAPTQNVLRSALRSSGDLVKPMRWLYDKGSVASLAPNEEQWMREFMSFYDLVRLRSVSVKVSPSVGAGMSGRLFKAVDQDRDGFMGIGNTGYDMWVNLEGGYPDTLEVRELPRPAASLLRGCTSWFDETNRVIRKVTMGRVHSVSYHEIANLQEGFLWVMLHEFYHFLKLTKQIEGRNTELYADQFAAYVFKFRSIGNLTNGMEMLVGQAMHFMKTIHEGLRVTEQVASKERNRK